MIWIRTLQLGVKSLLLHPMRSLLTVLGIFIGVAAVIWLLAISEGISREAQKQIEGLGANNIIVRSIKPPEDSGSSSGGFSGAKPYGLTRADYARLVSTIPTISNALPIREIRSQFSNAGRTLDGRLVGCTPDYDDAMHLKIARGRFIAEADLIRRQTYCVIAAEVAEQLFPGRDALHRKLYLTQSRDYYEIIGILQRRTPTAAIGGSLAAQDFSRDVYIPSTTLQTRIGDFIVRRGSGTFEVEVVELNQITLQVDKVENVMRTSEIVRQTLENHEKTQDTAIITPLELLEQARTTRLMFMVLMGLIAAISLLVGGIGIMNIMLATVTERTREIGIRRALGARRSDIVRQFLVETIVMSGLGGLTGVLVGLAGPWVITTIRDSILLPWAPKLMSQLPDVARNVEPTIVPLSIPLAFGISVFIGVVFGLYPAIRAAKMDPIEALRHE
ncbi:ABC transporter permease [Lignipirellula cremea]|nr:ABC transporter permease [Lignipirellula cremea]